MLAALASTALLAPANAHEASSPTRVEALYEMHSPRGNQFIGGLQGPERCVVDRTVRIIREGSGSIGSAQTRRNGTFLLRKPGVPDDTYFAKVRRHVNKRDGHRHVCGKDRSPGIAIAGDCEATVLSGGPNPTDTINVDDDVLIRLDGGPVLSDSDDMASEHSAQALGATSGGEVLRVTANNSIAHAGQMSIDPLWIHCPDRDVAFALDPDGFSADSGGSGEVFYDRRFVIGDFVQVPVVP